MKGTEPFRHEFKFNHDVKVVPLLAVDGSEIRLSKQLTFDASVRCSSNAWFLFTINRTTHKHATVPVSWWFPSHRPQAQKLMKEGLRQKKIRHRPSSIVGLVCLNFAAPHGSGFAILQPDFQRNFQEIHDP